MAHDIILFLFALLLVLSPLLIHEAGHWAVLHRHRVPVTEAWIGLGPAIFRWKRIRIGMLPIGAALVPEPVAFGQMPAKGRLLTALAGPLASLIYGLTLLSVVYTLPASGDKTLDLLLPVAYLNFVLAGVNILPIPPLDGFHVYKAWREMKDRPLSPRITRVAHRLGNGFVFGIGFFVLAKFFF